MTDTALPPTSEVIRSAFVKRHELANQMTGVGTRHIFVFLDGTWNEDRSEIGAATSTNVLRMYRELRIGRSHGDHEVVAHYFRGVGSLQDNAKASRAWHGFSGQDEQRIRGAAFAAVYQEYKSHRDKIYIIGFSRGAASARLLARNICEDGFASVLTVTSRHFPNRLTGQIEQRVESIEQTSGPDHVHPRVAFLGCWDTVDAFVLPSRFPENGFKDRAARLLKKCVTPLVREERFKKDEISIPEGVKRAVHCVAIDETRNAFLPTLMPAATNVDEVWFPGVHADVGGGYTDNLLAEESYAFMRSAVLEAAEQNGLKEGTLFKNRWYDIEEERRKGRGYCFHFHAPTPRWQGAMTRAGFGYATRKIRVLGGETDQAPKIHASIRTVSNEKEVFAADRKGKRTWTVTYNPYNVAELDNYTSVERPFEDPVLRL